MVSIRIIGCSVLLLTAFSGISALPVQLHGEPVELDNAAYSSPELAEALARSYAALEWAQKNEEPADDIELRNLDQIGGGGTRVQQNSGDGTHTVHPHQFGRLLSGMTFGDNRDFDFQARKPEWMNRINGMDIYEGSIKRNIDEIDRSGFDNFVKRNFDEIDRSGWDSFVKRRMMNAYLVGRPH